MRWQQKRSSQGCLGTEPPEPLIHEIGKHDGHPFIIMEF
jgi:hypothetical protein